MIILLTYYETADGIRQMMKGGIDVEAQEKGGHLMIVDDITKFYFRYAGDFLSFIDRHIHQNEKLLKKDITVIADMGIFYHSNNKK